MSRHMHTKVGPRIFRITVCNLKLTSGSWSPSFRLLDHPCSDTRLPGFCTAFGSEAVSLSNPDANVHNLLDS